VTRSGFRTLLVGGAALGFIVCAAFAVQAAALGRPGPVPLILAKMVGKLDAFHEADATMTIDGRTRTTACDQRWTKHARIAVVTVAHGPTIRKIGPQLHYRGKVELDEFLLAGCPRPLSHWIATQLDRSEHIIVRDVRLGSDAVYEIRFRHAADDLEVDVSRSQLLPVQLTVGGGGVTGVSKPRYVRPLPRTWWSGLITQSDARRLFT